MRSLFDHEAPSGVHIEQRYALGYTDEAHRNHIDVTFVAVCDHCGATTGTRALRSDALDDLDGHACSTAVELPL